MMTKRLLVVVALLAMLGCQAAPPLPNNTRYTVVDEAGTVRFETIGCRSTSFEHWDLETSIVVYRCHESGEVVALQTVLPVGWAFLSEEIGGEDG